MDIKKLYRNLSDRFILDFEDSSLANHNVIKGDYREASLKEFLLKGRLPKRFDIGKGEIISSFLGVSKQSDLIIYDSIEGISFQGKEDLRVFPIESICGIIEVKSCLSKEKLIEGLENIKSVKMLTQDDSIVEYRGGFSITTPRPKPFGIIFAYKLGNNSLESLRQNLIEWESQNDKKYFPNLIIVLNEGIIRHTKGIKDCIYNEDILESTSTIALQYKKDSLFQFYSALLDLCARTKAGQFNLTEYFDPPYLVDDLIVKNHNRFIVQPKDNNQERYAGKLKDSFIHQVYDWCKTQGKVPHKSYYEQCIGIVPTDLDKKHLEYPVYLYNPKNLPPNDNKYVKIDGVPQKANNDTLAPGHFIHINKEVYYIPWNYITDDVIEVDSQTDLEDLEN